MSARILAVEDTPALRALLQLSLTRAGYKVDLAEEGLTAVEMFLAGEYDAVIMDVQMPVMDGLAAVARMREWEKGQNRAPAPMLALTANLEPSDLRKCIEAGLTAAFRKPFAREELLAEVARLLGAKAADARIVVTVDREFADLIPPFLDSCRLAAEEMTQALERHDYRKLAALSHKLTGTGASYGFQPLSEESRRIEAAAKAADDAELLKSLEAIKLYLERVSVVYP